ncbi:hypothetical protein PCE1_004845 [Barthelona sp. PCE]
MNNNMNRNNSNMTMDSNMSMDDLSITIEGEVFPTNLKRTSKRRQTSRRWRTSTTTSIQEICPGEVYQYKSRYCDSESLCLILRVDVLDDDSEVVHVAINNLHLSCPHINDIPHIPIEGKTLRKDLKTHVTNIDDLDENDIGEGYEEWLELFNKGEAGFWCNSLSNVIQSIDDQLSSETKMQMIERPSPTEIGDSHQYRNNNYDSFDYYGFDDMSLYTA